MIFQMTDVSWLLNSVGNMCDAGKRVMLGKRGGVIWDIATNLFTKFPRKKDGVYELKLWLKDGTLGSGFTRPGL